MSKIIGENLADDSPIVSPGERDPSNPNTQIRVTREVATQIGHDMLTATAASVAEESARREQQEFRPLAPGGIDSVPGFRQEDDKK